MDRRRQHEDQYQYQPPYGQHHRANKNKRKAAAKPPPPLGSTVPAPPLGPGLTPEEAIKLMQQEREGEEAKARHGSGTKTKHIGDGDHLVVDDVNSNNNGPGSSASAKQVEAEVLDNHNGNSSELSRSTSAGFVSATEGDDTDFGSASGYPKAKYNVNNSNSSSASATFTDAREDSDDVGVERSYQNHKMGVGASDVQNGNSRSDEGVTYEYDEDDTTPMEECTHASLIVNLSTDNTSVDFRERRSRIDLPLDESDPLSSARSAPPDLLHGDEAVDDERSEKDDGVQYLYSSTPSRPQQPNPMPLANAATRDAIPVITLDSTVELDDSVSADASFSKDKNDKELDEAKPLQNQNKSEAPEISQNSAVEAADVSSTSTNANTTSTTLDKDKTANTTIEVNSAKVGENSVSAVEEVQVPEVAMEAGLPKTVTVLQASNGTTVYLVGTAHFSEASQADVIKTIREVQPRAVFLELCQARQHILIYDEETILREASNLNLEKVRFAIKKSGAVQGALHLLLLSISCSITKKLGMAPGGEFRVGFKEAQKLRHPCDIIFGDRAFAVTLARALDSLTLWQKLKLAWQFLTTSNDITKEEIERCKEKDILEQMLEEMVGEYPTISHVFVGERDIYLAHSLWLSALATDGPVVGIVGIGHVPGITRQWGQTNESQVNEVNQMPKTSRTSIVVRKTIKIGFYCLVGYGVYKVGARMIGGTRLQTITLPEAISSRLGSLKMSSFTNKY